MKRHLLIAAVFLLAGAVVNVAVAWGCALWTPELNFRLLSDPWSEWILRGEPDDLPSSTVQGVEREHIGITITEFQVGRPGAPVQVVCLHTAGFPFASFSGRADYARTLRAWLETGPHMGAPFDFRTSPRRMLPLCVNWPGWLSNTTIYAALLGLLTLARRAARQPRILIAAGKLVALLGAGLAVSVVVAVACTWWSPSSRVVVLDWSRARATFRLLVPDSKRFSGPFGGFEHDHPGLSVTEVHVGNISVGRSSAVGPPLHVRNIRAGWPVHCVELTEQTGAYADPAVAFVALPAAPYNFSTPRHKLIPRSPLWEGLICDGLFYAAVLWLLIPGPFALRRFIRVRRGLCPACAYDLRHGEHDVCPECGRVPSAR